MFAHSSCPLKNLHIYFKDMSMKSGIIIYANTLDVIKTFDNKWETFVRLRSLGVKTPDTTLDSKDQCFFRRNTYPLVIKPVYGNASKNVFVVDSEEELECISRYLKIKDIPYVIQEHIGNENEEFTISVLSDLSGQYLGSIVLIILITKLNSSREAQ